MNRPERHYQRGEARRSLLLDAAVQTIAERGLEGVTHRSIATAAGVPLSATSYFFESLDDLIAAAVVRVADDVLERLDSLVKDVGGAEITADTIAEFGERLAEAVTESGSMLLIAQFEAYLGAGRRDGIASSVRKIIEAYETTALAVMRILGAPMPEAAARQLVATLDGFAVQRIAYPRPDDTEMLSLAIRSLARAHLSM